MGYYMGDYYRGDPGFWSSALQFGKGLLGYGMPGTSMIKAPVQAIERVAGPMVRKAGAAVIRHPVLSAAGAAGAGIGVGAITERGMAPGVAPKGFHPCKHPGKCKHAIVRNRHMRVSNPRALRRALRRVGGFSRLARRVMHFTSPRSRGRLTFKFPKRRRK